MPTKWRAWLYLPPMFRKLPLYRSLLLFVNEDMRSFCQGQLTQSQLPTSPRDLQVQVEQLTQQVKGIAARMSEPARKGF